MGVRGRGGDTETLRGQGSVDSKPDTQRHAVKEVERERGMRRPGEDTGCREMGQREGGNAGTQKTDSGKGTARDGDVGQRLRRKDALRHVKRQTPLGMRDLPANQGRGSGRRGPGSREERETQRLPETETQEDRKAQGPAQAVGSAGRLRIPPSIPASRMASRGRRRVPRFCLCVPELGCPPPTRTPPLLPPPSRSLLSAPSRTYIAPSTARFPHPYPKPILTLLFPGGPQPPPRHQLRTPLQPPAAKIWASDFFWVSFPPQPSALPLWFSFPLSVFPTVNPSSLGLASPLSICIPHHILPSGSLPSEVSVLFSLGIYTPFSPSLSPLSECLSPSLWMSFPLSMGP